MDNTKAMLRQYLSIRVQLKNVGLLVDDIEQLSEEVIAKIVDKAGELTVDDFLTGLSDFSSSYPDEYEDLYLIGKKVGQGMSELRSSLDYFVRFLVYANGKTPHKDSKFPVIEDNIEKLSEDYKKEKRDRTYSFSAQKERENNKYLREERQKEKCLRKKRETDKFLGEKYLFGLTHDQKLSILDMQPAYAGHPQAAMLSAIHYYRNIYMHNAIPEIELSIGRGCPGGLSREEMRKKIAAIQVKDANISLRFAVSSEYLSKLENMMEQSDLHGPPDKLLGRFKMMVIDIMNRLNVPPDDRNPDFDFNLYNDRSRGVL